ncbi:unnamed protein product [Colias eurytheme]|nr:unnamed protein product [Colias eurytheme]
MKNILWVVERKNEHNVFRITSFLLVFLSIFRIKNTLGCPDLIKSDKCLCYKFEDDVFLDCQDTSLKDISNALQSLTFIHTFSIYDLDSSEEKLGPYIIPQNTCIKHVHISRTSLKEVNDEAFAPLKKCLETISIVSSKVKLIPQKALSGMLKLLSVEFTSNYIEEIPNYSFYGLPLLKLNIKGNMVQHIADKAFSGLENTVTDIDLSENNLTSFPIIPIANLKLLQTMRLSWNEISSFPDIEHTGLKSLEYLDLNSNNFEFISEDCLKFSPSLTILSFHFNFIVNIHYPFKTLNKIIEIDLQHNKLQNIPIELLNSIENHVKDISIEENVIICRCQKNNTWTWIQDHPKIIKPNAVKCLNDEYPNGKCNFPLIAQVSVDKHNDNSVSVSWFIRNRTSIKAIQIMYYDDDDTSEVYSKLIDTSETSTSLDELHNNMNYIVCVLAIYEYPLVSEVAEEDINKSDFYFNSLIKMNRSIAAIEITQSSSSECVSFDTFKKPLTVKMKNNKVFKISSILNRRLGLIVGCSLGVVVFFVMVSVLLYTKIKERKRIAKSDPAWSEMNDYHSIHSKEDILQSSTTASTDNILLGMAKNRNVSLDKIK